MNQKKKKKKWILVSSFLVVPSVPFFVLSQTNITNNRWIQTKTVGDVNPNWKNDTWLRGFNNLKWNKRNYISDGITYNANNSSPYLGILTRMQKLQYDYWNSEHLGLISKEYDLKLNFDTGKTISNEYNLKNINNWENTNLNFLNFYIEGEININDSEIRWLPKYLIDDYIIGRKRKWYEFDRKVPSWITYAPNTEISNSWTNKNNHKYIYIIDKRSPNLSKPKRNVIGEFLKQFNINELSNLNATETIAITNNYSLRPYNEATIWDAKEHYYWQYRGDTENLNGTSLDDFWEKGITGFHTLRFSNDLNVGIENKASVNFTKKDWFGIESNDFFNLVKFLSSNFQHKDKLTKSFKNLHNRTKDYETYKKNNTVPGVALKDDNGVLIVPSDTGGDLNTPLNAQIIKLAPNAKTNFQNLVEYRTSWIDREYYINEHGFEVGKHDGGVNKFLIKAEYIPEINNGNSINLKHRIKQIFYKNKDITNLLKNEMANFKTSQFNNVSIDSGSKNLNDIRQIKSMLNIYLNYGNTVIRNIPVAFEDSNIRKKFKSVLNLSSRLNITPGKVLKNDKNLDNIQSINPLSFELNNILVDDKFIRLEDDPKNKEENSKNIQWGGRWLAKAPISIQFEANETENEVLIINGKNVDVLNRNFMFDFRDLRLDINDNQRIPFDAKDANNPNIVLDEKNSHAKNEYVVELLKFAEGSNNDSDPIVKFKIIYVIDSLNTKQTLKWFAWDPENNPNQLDLITKELIVNGKVARDDNGNIRENPKYDPTINKDTGTKNQIVYIPNDTLTSNVKQRLKNVYPDIQLNNLGVIAEASVLGKGALRNLDFSTNSKNPNYFRVKLFDKRLNQWIENPIIQDISTTGTDSKNSYMSEEGIWLVSATVEGGISNVKLILIDEDNLPNNYFLNELNNKKDNDGITLDVRFEDFWTTFLGSRFLTFLNTHLSINESDAKNLPYEILMDNYLYYVNLSWKSKIRYNVSLANDDILNNKNHINLFENIFWKTSKDFNGLTSLETLESEVRKYLDLHLKIPFANKYIENNDWIIDEWSSELKKNQWLRKLAKVKLKSDFDYKTYNGITLTLKGINSYYNPQYDKQITFKNSAWHVYNPPIDLNTLDIKDNFEIDIDKYNLLNTFISIDHYKEVIKHAIKYEIVDLIKKELINYKNKYNIEIILDKDVLISNLNEVVNSLFLAKDVAEFKINLKSLNANLLNEKVLNFSNKKLLETLNKPIKIVIPAIVDNSGIDPRKNHPPNKNNGFNLPLNPSNPNTSLNPISGDNTNNKNTNEKDKNSKEANEEDKNNGLTDEKIIKPINDANDKETNDASETNNSSSSSNNNTENEDINNLALPTNTVLINPSVGDSEKNTNSDSNQNSGLETVKEVSREEILKTEKFDLSLLTSSLLEKEHNLSTTSLKEIQRKVKEIVEEVASKHQLVFGEDYRIYALNSPSYWIDLITKLDNPNVQNNVELVKLINENKEFLTKASFIEIDGEKIAIPLTPSDPNIIKMLDEYYKKSVEAFKLIIQNNNSNEDVFSKMLIIIPTNKTKNFAYGYVFNVVDKDNNAINSDEWIKGLKNENKAAGGGLHNNPESLGGEKSKPSNTVDTSTILWGVFGGVGVIIISIASVLTFKYLSKKSRRWWLFGKEKKKKIPKKTDSKIVDKKKTDVNKNNENSVR